MVACCGADGSSFWSYYLNFLVDADKMAFGMLVYPTAVVKKNTQQRIRSIDVTHQSISQTKLIMKLSCFLSTLLTFMSI